MYVIRVQSCIGSLYVCGIAIDIFCNKSVGRRIYLQNLIAGY